ncbi:MAG: hypothetical protein HBSAPP03_04810 [Phycisphaerae bacterium]|nr:MAG: hypothetical protein HBSAPP03_04810 [Phycisphaerae bacterium]
MSAPASSASVRRTLGQIVALAAALAVFHAPALAQPDPSGIDFVTITHPGNAAWDGTGITPDVRPPRYPPRSDCWLTANTEIASAR